MEVRLNYFEKYPMERVEKRRRFCVELTTTSAPTKVLKSLTRKTFQAVYEIAKKWDKAEKDKGNVVKYGNLVALGE